MGDGEIKSKSNNLFETTDFDNSVSLTGYGKFHYETILVCALSIITIGFQNGLSSYVFPSAQCELNLSSFEVGLLNVSFLVGATVSSFLWGILADEIGRRKVLYTTHLINAFVTIVCAINQYTETLLICRFFNGFLIGAPGSIIFSYLAEFQPPKYRAASVCYCGLFFTSAWLLLPLLAYVVLPLPISVNLGSFFVLSSWRFFLILLAIPEIIVGLWFIRMPESPKFFVAKGDPRQALMILRRMYSTNTGRSPEKYPVKNLTTDVKIETSICNVGNRGKLARLSRNVFNQIESLFRPPLLKITLLTCFIMFANMFGVFGLGLWLPELFVRFQQFQELNPNATATVSQLSTLSQMKNATCEPSFDAAVIQNTVAMACTSLAFNAISGWFSSRVQLKTIPLISMLMGGLSSLSIYWLSSSIQNLIVSCIFQATMVTANMTIGSVGVELFPTKVGGIAICLIMCCGRIGAMCSNFLFGYYMDKQCEIPIFVVAFVVLLGAALCMVIPKKSSSEGINNENSYLPSRHIEISVIQNVK